MVTLTHGAGAAGTVRGTERLGSRPCWATCPGDTCRAWGRQARWQLLAGSPGGSDLVTARRALEGPASVDKLLLLQRLPWFGHPLAKFKTETTHRPRQQTQGKRSQGK